MEYKPLALHPEDVQFETGRTYYAKLRFSHKIEPIYCVATGDEADRRSSVYKNEIVPNVSVWPTTYAIRSDIEYIVGGVPDEVLNRINQERLFGTGRVAGVEKGRGKSAPKTKRNLVEARKTD